jgi:hypothetical protein
MRTAVTGALAGALVTACLALGAGTATAAARSGGPIEVWGGTVAEPVRSTYTGDFVAAASTSNDTGVVGIRANGSVEVLKADGVTPGLESALAGKQVVDLVTNNRYALALTASGEVVSMKGGTSSSLVPLEVPAGVQGNVAQVVLGTQGGVLRLRDGSLSGIGTGPVATAVPAGAFADVAAYGQNAIALKADGSVVAWGGAPAGTNAVPAELAGVRDVELTDAYAFALSDDSTITAWGANLDTGGNVGIVAPPTSASLGGRVVELARTQKSAAALTDDGRTIVWGAPGTEAMQAVPAGLDGKGFLRGGTTTYFAVGSNQQAVLAVATKGKITGAPKVGQTLTGTAATFNDASATVTRQWLVGGQPVEGATGATFTPTAAHVGKPVALRSTATRGTDTLTDTSAATANVAPATASTSVAVSGSTSVRYGTLVRWTVTVRGGTPAGGTVTVAGSGVSTRATVSRGRAVVTLPRTLNPATRTLRVTYSGDAAHTGSYRNVAYRVVKANASASARVTVRPTTRKAGKVRVTVRGSGPARATGRVTVTVQKGRTRYTVRGNVRSNGTVDLSVRKLAKGTWTVRAVYAGDARYNSRTTGSVRVKVSR